MITYVLCQRTTGYDKIQKNDMWLLSMFDARHQNGYVNVAWVIAKWMKKKGARTQKESQICYGQFISKLARKCRVLTDNVPGVPKVGIPIPPRASMQDLYDRIGMFLSQKKYALKLLDKAHVANCNPTRTSVDTESKLGSDGDLISHPTLCRILAGSLVACTDADWSGFPTTRLSTSSYSVFLRDNLLSESWLAKRKHTLFRSSVEAEYKASADQIYEIDIYIVCDMVSHGKVHVLHVPSRYQYADIFTKVLPSTLFEEFRISLSVRPSLAQTVGEC
uniref:Uncharacterized protein n=1 Tax=Tanacetum cinerariifolium TaxID=118510 RepID=A0A6L2MED8_TANCI|nr:hypothetical protein [Tanacetum cinerariifolium]